MTLYKIFHMQFVTFSYTNLIDFQPAPTKATLNKHFHMRICTTNDAQIHKHRNIKILGLTLGNKGLQTHATIKKQQAEITLNTLRRFKKINTKAFLRLYKVLVRPLLEYILITTITIKTHQLNKLQRTQDKALKLATHSILPYLITIQELHTQHKLEQLKHKALPTGKQNLGQIIHHTHTHLVKQSNNMDTERHDHNWWSRITRTELQKISTQEK